MFSQEENRVSKVLKEFPYLEEHMGPFIESSILVLLSVISQCSKTFLQHNFFNRPSILAKMLENFNTLDELMIFQKPFVAYIGKQRLDISAQFNQCVSEMIMQKFGKELPELYIPVVNKLIFRYYYLWLNASYASLKENSPKQTNQLAHSTRKNFNVQAGRGDDMVFNRARLLDNCQRLINKFKGKCLPDIITFKSKQDDQRTLALQITTSQRSFEHEQVCVRRQLQKKALTDIFFLMNEYYKKSQEKKGLEEIILLLLETAMLEFEETNKALNCSNVLFEMFNKIKYLEMDWKDVKIYIELVKKLLNKISLENVNYRVNSESFKAEFVKYIELLEETYHAIYHFRRSKDMGNIYLRALFGCRVIELLSKARLYHEIKKFSKKEYAPILENDLEWTVEVAFLDKFSYEILQTQVDQGEFAFASETMKSVTMSDEISSIVDKLVKQRCYALALDLNKKVKELYERNYDLERIQKPLETETHIYKRMHEDKRQNYSSYFKVQFVGNGHQEEFKNKTFILRSCANQQKIVIEEELCDKFDKDLNFIEDRWPNEEQLSIEHTKYCHLVKVHPLTLKEVTEFDLHDMVEKDEFLMDDEDQQLLEKIQAMPTKLQNFYIQNQKDKFYYQESIRMEGVDPVAFDQKVQIFAVKHKFPYISGLQQVTTQQEKIVSSVRQAIKDIKDTDNQLSIIKKIVREQAIDQGNVQQLETTLRKTLVTEINGGFQRYLIYFFNEQSLALKEREKLLLTLYVTMEEHFANVKESIELFSQHSTADSATSMFYSKLSALERMLHEMDKKLHIKRMIKQAEENKEEIQIQDAIRQSTNVFLERNSMKDFESILHHQSYLMHQPELSRIEKNDTSVEYDRYDDTILEEMRPQGFSILDNSRFSNMNFTDDSDSRTNQSQNVSKSAAMEPRFGKK